MVIVYEAINNFEFAYLQPNIAYVTHIAQNNMKIHCMTKIQLLDMLSRNSIPHKNVRADCIVWQ